MTDRVHKSVHYRSLAENLIRALYIDDSLHGPYQDPDYTYGQRESPFVPVDGEMDWSTGLPTGTSCNHPGGNWPVKVPAEVFAWRMREFHYSTLSIRHGYSHLDGNGRGKSPQPNNNETVDWWMRTPLNLTHLYYDKLPVSPFCKSQTRLCSSCQLFSGA